MPLAFVDLKMGCVPRSRPALLVTVLQEESALLGPEARTAMDGFSNDGYHKREKRGLTIHVKHAVVDALPMYMLRRGQKPFHGDILGHTGSYDAPA